MLRRWFAMWQKMKQQPAAPLAAAPVYRMGAVFMVIVAFEMIGVMICQEITQFRVSTSSSGWAWSDKLFFLLPVAIIIGLSLVVIWRVLRSGSAGRFEREPVALLFVLAGILAGITGGLYFMGHSSASTIAIWSIPSVVGLSLFVWIVLLALQLERIARGGRRWGFSVTGFDFRDTLNILVLGFLFFGVSHLVVVYDPLVSSDSSPPVWFLPLFAISAAVLLSCLSAAVLRFPMGASMAGFLMLGIRNALWTSLSAGLLGSSVIPVILGPVFVLDIWQWTKSGRASALSVASIACIALFLNYPIFDEWLGISFSGIHYAGILAVAFIIALVSARLAQYLGQGIETLGTLYDQINREPVFRSTTWHSLLLGFVALNGLVLFLILTV